MGYILFGIVVAAVLYVIAIYNSLVAKRNQIENGFAQIQVQLKRRYDLIPGLVKVAKGYMTHERETLEAVIEARNEASGLLQSLEGALDNADMMAQFNLKEQGFVGALGGMNFLMEEYPDLKANETMIRLMEELGSTENRIAFARQAYNDFVYAYNTDRQSFPQNQFASMFGFTSDAKMMEFDDAKAMQSMPKVNISSAGA